MGKVSYPELRLTKINQYSLLYYWPAQRHALKPICLMAHQDVVPAANADQWQHLPFSGYVSDTTIGGRRALDINRGE